MINGRFWTIIIIRGNFLSDKNIRGLISNPQDFIGLIDVLYRFL